MHDAERVERELPEASVPLVYTRGSVRSAIAHPPTPSRDSHGAVLSRTANDPIRFLAPAPPIVSQRA